MEKAPCYTYHRIAKQRGVVVQVRDPKTGEAVEARDLLPFRALQKIGCSVGSIPYGATVLVTLEVAEPMLDSLKPLPQIDTVKGGKIIAKAREKVPEVDLHAGAYARPPGVTNLDLRR